MYWSRTHLLAVSIACLALGQSSFAQQQRVADGLPQPRLTAVSPTGAKAGTSFELVLTGSDLDDAQSLVFSIPGVKAERLESKPINPMPRDKGNRGMRGQQAIASASFRVTLPPDAPLGFHDVRLVNRFGVSNPRAFVVGDLPEIVEREPNNDIEPAQRVQLNTTISGVIASPTDIDYFAFTGKAGQRVVVSCLTASIDSRLQAELQIFDAEGRQLAFNRNYSGDDALLDAVLPTNGDYFVRVAQFTYTQGGPDSFYRLTISTTPWIDAVFPPMVEPGKETKVTVYGRNLPGGVPDPSAVLGGRPLDKLEVTLKPNPDAAKRVSLDYRGLVPPAASGLDGFEFRLKNDAGTSNPYLITYASAPVVVDAGNNDSRESAQKVTTPCEIAGRIEKRRDVDWYMFHAKKGEVWSLELFGDRLGSASAFRLAVFGNRPDRALVEADDNPDTLSLTHFYTRSDDPPRLRFTAPEDGDYRVRVSSRESFVQSGPRNLYRLRITPEKPDYRLVALPGSFHQADAVNIDRGGNQYLMVYAWRMDGFDGPISLTADGLPAGVACSPQTLGPGEKQGVLVLTADKSAKTSVSTFRVKGTAQIAGASVVREARPASVTWGFQLQQNQQLPNAPLLSRLDRSLVMAVRESASFRLTAPESEFKVNVGDKLTIPVKLERISRDFKGQVQLFGLGLPANVNFGQGNNRNNPAATIPADKNEVNAVIDVRNGAVPGTYTIALRGLATGVPFARDVEGKDKSTANVFAPTTPITITVLPRKSR